VSPVVRKADQERRIPVLPITEKNKTRSSSFRGIHLHPDIYMKQPSFPFIIHFQDLQVEQEKQREDLEMDTHSRTQIEAHSLFFSCFFCCFHSTQKAGQCGALPVLTLGKLCQSAAAP
jgi:hypothetical protein